MTLWSLKRKEVREEYTVAACRVCGMTSKRRFTDGDFVFANAAEGCASCGGAMMICCIFSEVL